MTANPVVCPECGSAVPSGRLSCTSCGALLASVTGADRRTIARTAPDRPAEAFDEDRPIGGAEAEPAARAEPEPEPESQLEAEPEPAPEARDEPEPEPEPEAASAQEARAAPDSEPELVAELERAPEPVAPQQPPAAAAELRQTRAEPSILHEWTGPEPEASSDAATLPVAPPALAAERSPGPAIPGAYLAPSATFAAPIASPSRPAPSAGGPGASGMPPPVASGAPSVLGRFAVAIPREVPGWLAITGSALAIASFLLPWATDGVIGASGNGYFANWGLANPGHLLLLLAAGVVLVLNVFPDRLPGWIRTGVLPLVVGGVLLGLAFAYDARPFGGGTGVTVLIVAALVLLIGGLLGVRPGRSESGPPSV
jgi:hypothetical protein